MAGGANSNAGLVFICLIWFILLISIAVGGSCLVAYTILPYPPPWLPYVGIATVCLPWLFWLLTFLYRIVSRAFGFRMVIGDCYGGGEGSVMDTTNNTNTAREAVSMDSSTVKHEEEGSKSKKRNSTSSSITSDESERPLAGSMAV